MNYRIKQIRKNFNLSQEAFGNRIGVTRGVINNLERGLTKLTAPLFELLCSTYNVNPDWLRTGDGDMFNPIDNTPLAALKEKYNLSDKALTIIQNFLSLSKSEQNSFIAQAEKIFHTDD